MSEGACVHDKKRQLIMPPTQYVQVNVYLLERLCESELMFYRTSQEK